RIQDMICIQNILKKIDCDEAFHSHKFVYAANRRHQDHNHDHGVSALESGSRFTAAASTMKVIVTRAMSKRTKA
ncbi:4017_t:CDS:2, partial [Scutellospora calospora]